jgi:hypothetical protein
VLSPPPSSPLYGVRALAGEFLEPSAGESRFDLAAFDFVALAKNQLRP